MSVNDFIIWLMRSVAGVMFFSGMAMLGYAVIGGYTHYTHWLHALGWGLAGWCLFWTGKDTLEKYVPPQQAAAPAMPPMPIPQAKSPYANVGNASPAAVHEKFGGGGQRRRKLDDQKAYD